MKTRKLCISVAKPCFQLKSLSSYSLLLHFNDIWLFPNIKGPWCVTLRLFKAWDIYSKVYFWQGNLFAFWSWLMPLTKVTAQLAAAQENN